MNYDFALIMLSFTKVLEQRTAMVRSCLGMQKNCFHFLTFSLCGLGEWFSPPPVPTFLHQENGMTHLLLAKSCLMLGLWSSVVICLNCSVSSLRQRQREHSGPVKWMAHLPLTWVKWEYYYWFYMCQVKCCDSWICLSADFTYAVIFRGSTGMVFFYLFALYFPYLMYEIMGP